MIVLVSGANRGIGLEVCRQLALAGHQVILTSRNVEKGRKAVQEIKEAYMDLHYHPLDVTNAQSVKEIRHFLEKEFGRLDILINNAGINYDTWQTALNADLEESRKTLEVNLFGVWRLSKSLIPLMIKNRYGRIVNVSSGSGALNEMGSGTPAYSISKAALNALTIKLARETQDKSILVNSVCPGWVRTDMGGAQAPRSVAEGARGIIWAATLSDDGPSGGFFRDGKRIDW